MPWAGISRPFRAFINFVASFVGNFVAFDACCRFFLTEARRHRGAENRNREWTLIHANEFDGAAWRGTAKIAKIAKHWSKRVE